MVSEQEPSYILVPSPTTKADLVTHTDYVVFIPLATRETYGSVKIGDGLNIVNGKVSLNTKYIPIQSISKNGTLLFPDENQNIDISIEKSDVGLDNVDNTSDLDKPISVAQQTAIDAKLNKNLGAANYNKILYVNASGEVDVKTAAMDIDYEMSDISNNAVANRVIKQYVDENGGKIDSIVIDDVVQEIVNKQIILDLHDYVKQTDLDNFKNESDTTYAKLKANQTFTGSQTIIGNLTIEGDIVQNGDQYITSAEQVQTENDYIIMRNGAKGSLGDGFSGFEIINYDGSGRSLRLVVDSEGTARVGDIGDEQPLLTREETEDLTDGEVLVWNANTNRAEGSSAFAKTTDLERYVPNADKTRVIYGTNDNKANATYWLDYSNTANVNRIPFRADNGAIMITDKSCVDGGSGAIPDGLQAVNKNFVKNNFVKQEEGKGLSSNDFTQAYIDKIAELENSFPTVTRLV